MSEKEYIIEELYQSQNTSDEGILALLQGLDEYEKELLAQKARMRRHENYGHDVYVRGLIEFTNYCKNNCLYCGIRAGNTNAQRYRLSKEQILECAQAGYELGFRTFVLQGGEDPYYTDDLVCDIVNGIRTRYPDCAVTLSIGEKSKESYRRYFEAGAERYLLRHETANEEHYNVLHPAEMSLTNRKRCLYDLREIGYQVGCGIMVGSPMQTLNHIVEDLRFMQDLQPHMIGIGPFISHKDTPFADQKSGTLEQTAVLLSIIRLMFPKVLLPATTALGTIHPLGREKGILAGANVLMPNLSPTDVRSKYLLYDGKICTGDEAAECKDCLNRRMNNIGYNIVTGRGDSLVKIKK